MNRKEMFSNRLDNLMRQISIYLETHDEETAYRIKEEYRDIKKEIRGEANYLKCRRNDISHISKKHMAYSKGIIGASAYGFTAKTNSSINSKMISSVEEARYRLNKFFYM